MRQPTAEAVSLINGCGILQYNDSAEVAEQFGRSARMMSVDLLVKVAPECVRHSVQCDFARRVTSSC